MSTPVAPKANHGFYLFGEQSLVLTHIPMFMSPHQAQLFMQVSLSTTDGTDAAPIYLKDKKQTGTSEYVLVSDPLELPTLAPDAPNRLQSFTGNLYRGWPFDQQWQLNPNQLLIPNVTVKVTRSIHYSSIATPTTLEQLTYYCFSTPETTYLAHVLSQPPDFKHILTAQVSGPGNSAAQGAIRLEFPGVANLGANRLIPAEQTTAVTAPGGQSVEVQVDDELIFDDNPQHLGEPQPQSANAPFTQTVSKNVISKRTPSGK
jgi:hypothetical protein